MLKSFNDNNKQTKTTQSKQQTTTMNDQKKDSKLWQIRMQKKKHFLHNNGTFYANILTASCPKS